ncbi:hypothetical protein SDC9_123402 [bioreactor metagenome]|uniref:Uncharacterized protein n=1 Tax=bioreactor metagenome TaxID=1076179 RepID=A0A645CHP6_9ZZZZ
MTMPRSSWLRGSGAARAVGTSASRARSRNAGEMSSSACASKISTRLRSLAALRMALDTTGQCDRPLPRARPPDEFSTRPFTSSRLTKSTSNSPRAASRKSARRPSLIATVRRLDAARRSARFPTPSITRSKYSLAVTRSLPTLNTSSLW